jgi:hypothetical protein
MLTPSALLAERRILLFAVIVTEPPALDSLDTTTSPEVCVMLTGCAPVSAIVPPVWLKPSVTVKLPVPFRAAAGLLVGLRRQALY